MNHLFVCSAGIARSKEAVFVAYELAEFYKIHDYEADYFGVNSGQNPNPSVFEKYNLIIAMDELNKTDLMKKFKIPEEKIKVLGIPDEHSRSESKLRKILDSVLLEKLEPIFIELAKITKKQS